MRAAADTGTINVTAGGTCGWSATSPVQWITFTAPASGTGNGSVGYNVAANTNSSSRSATITVAGQPFVVTQAGAACDATLNPASQNFTVAGGNGGTAVTVPAGCTWSAVPSAAWITVLTGATGSGNGNVTYSVSANPNGTTRNGTIAIGGKLLNVTQDAAACTSTVSSTSESFESTGGTRSVSVTTPAGCSWTAASNSQWITVTSGAGPNTSGNGAVTFQVAANATTTARTGSLTIAGKTVNVNQAGTCDVTLAPTGVSAGAAASTGLVGVATGSTLYLVGDVFSGLAHRDQWRQWHRQWDRRLRGDREHGSGQDGQPDDRRPAILRATGSTGMHRVVVTNVYRLDAGDCLQRDHGHRRRRLHVDDDQHGVVDYGDVWAQWYGQWVGLHEHRGEQYEC